MVSRWRSVTFFFSWKSCGYKLEICGGAEQATGENVIRRMRFACWVTKVTNTPSEYVIFIVLPPQHWLRERALVLCYSALHVVLSLSSNFDELWHSYDFSCAPSADGRRIYVLVMWRSQRIQYHIVRVKLLGCSIGEHVNLRLAV
jgi:hypothetical protein